MLAYREMSNDDLFSEQWVKVALPPEELPGYKGERIVCAECGEGINFQREVRRDGKILCRGCAGERYYEDLLIAVWRRTFKRIRDASACSATCATRKHCRLIEMFAQDLHADRQSFFALAAGNGNSGNARQIRRHCENVSQVHGQRIVRLFAQLECRRRRRGSDDGVHRGECLIEVARQQAAHPLRLQVIGIVISGAQAHTFPA